MGRLLSSLYHESKALDNTVNVTDPTLDMSQGSEFTLKEANSVRASTAKVVCCDFSSDGKLLASGGHDKEVSLWYTDTLDPKARLQGHSSLITDVRFCPRLPRLATSSFDKTVRVWEDIAGHAGYATSTFTGHSSPVMSLDFHPNDSNLLCSCDSNAEIRYWSVNNNTCLRVLNAHQGSMTHVRFEPRLGNYLAADRGNIVSILDVETQACVLSLQGHSSRPFNSVCWHPSGEFLASVTEALVRIWTIGSGTKGDCIHQLSSWNDNKFFSCAFHPVFPSVLVVGCYKSLELWDVIENRTVNIPAHEAMVANLAASNLNRWIASASHDKLIKLWK